MSNQYTDKDRIARICWNENYWRFPSGTTNKSKNKKSFEDIAGFGYEEWLFDMEKLVDDYHYSFIEAVNRNWEKYQKMKFNLSLYTINGQTRERWWIGEIKNVEVIDRAKSLEILNIYKQNGWISEMIEQLKSVNADTKQFKLGDPQNNNIFNIRFEADNLFLFDEPLQFSAKDPVIKAAYTSTLLFKTKEPDFNERLDKKFIFKSGFNRKKESATRNYSQQSKNTDLFHNRISDQLSEQLIEIYGENNVSTEQETGCGTKIDIAVRGKDKYLFFEIKTTNSLRNCIREALAQLIEYSYFPDRNLADELIIVSPNIMTDEISSYLEHLRKIIKIPVYYQRYNTEKNKLEIKKY